MCVYYIMEDPTLKTLFGPLSRKYCIWFYWLSVVGFILLILVVISAILALFSKKMGPGFYYAALSSGIAYAIFYFQNRLLYTMCAGSA